MCMQCVAGVTTAGVAATGTRAWLATRSWAWLTPARMKAITIALLVTALVVASTSLSAS
jgi:hypothetical protein